MTMPYRVERDHEQTREEVIAEVLAMLADDPSWPQELTITRS